MTELLRGRTVFLSASVPAFHRSEEYRVDSEIADRIESAVIATARAVLGQGGQLVLGGHPSISLLVALVAGEYGPVSQDRTELTAHFTDIDNPSLDAFRVLIYQSRAYEGYLPDETYAIARTGLVAIRWVEAYQDEKYNPELRGRPQCDRSLASMRMRMLAESKPVAMVGIGGMEGLEREYELFAATCDGPIYLLESTGGATRKIVSQRRLAGDGANLRFRHAAHALPDESSATAPGILDRVHIPEADATDGNGDGDDWVDSFKKFQKEFFGDWVPNTVGHLGEKHTLLLSPPYDFLIGAMVEEIAHSTRMESSEG